MALLETGPWLMKPLWALGWGSLALRGFQESRRAWSWPPLLCGCGQLLSLSGPHLLKLHRGAKLHLVRGFSAKSE